jgi:hypothetical protein
VVDSVSGFVFVFEQSDACIFAHCSSCERFTFVGSVVMNRAWRFFFFIWEKGAFVMIEARKRRFR